jgi:hypothetical protein
MAEALPVISVVSVAITSGNNHLALINNDFEQKTLRNSLRPGVFAAKNIPAFTKKAPVCRQGPILCSRAGN